MLLRTIGPFIPEEWDGDNDEPFYAKRKRGGKKLALCIREVLAWFDYDPKEPFWLELHNNPSACRVEYIRRYYRTCKDWEIFLVRKDGNEELIDLVLPAHMYMVTQMPAHGYISLVQ